jgi:archaeal flagellin FlaB
MYYALMDWKTAKKVFRDTQGMTGLETAMILIAFVTVAAIFGYAVLSSGLFSAERGKETHYAALKEAQSNIELCGSVIATSTDGASARKVILTIKNAIAGAPIDMTVCDGTPSAANKCVVGLTTAKGYLSNVKWTKQPVGQDNGNNLLEHGEKFEIIVDLADLGDNKSRSENVTASQTFTLQVKPAIGASISVQRTLPAALGPVMDLDLLTGSRGASGAP